MKINLIKVRSQARKRFLFMIMKTYIFLLCTTVFSLTSENSFSQEKVIINQDQLVTVDQVFKIIKQQTNYRFIYPKNLFKGTPKVQLKKGEIKITELLKQSLSSNNLNYKLTKNNTIVIKKTPVNNIENRQQKEISGTITDSARQPLPGASVIEKGTINGVQTDFDGNFTLKITGKNAVLVISYIGFATQEITVGQQTTISIVLQEDAASLDEVVVVGYGKQSKQYLTTAITKVNYETLAEQNVTSFEEALSGQVAGMRVIQSTGAPGGNISVQIRGVGSVSSSNEPLYVIDGVPIDNDLRGVGGKVSSGEQPTNPLSSINPEDIESINVLKDAASTSIYGSRGSNGVIIITTKSGKKGKMRVSYKNSFSIQTVLKKLDILDAYEYAKLSIDGQNENYINNSSGNPDRTIDDPNGIRGGKGTIAPVLYPYNAGIKGLTNTDWQDEIFRIALVKKHNISVSGGSDNSNYYVSGGFLDQEGVVINSNFKRYSFRFKYNVNYDKVKFGINLAPSYLDYDLVQSEGPYWRGGVISAALLYAPVLPVYNPDGTFNYGNNNWGYGHTNIINPVATATLLEDRKQNYRLLGNAFMSYRILEGLTNKITVGIDINNFKRDTYSPSTLQIRGRSDRSEAFGRTRASFTTNFLFENVLTYKKQIGLNKFSLIGGFSAQKNRVERSFAKVTGFANDLVHTLNAGTIAESAFSNGSEWSLLSYFSRLEYNYNGKYLASLSARADGSSRFSKNNKWGYFPSASLGWIISKENFLEKNQTISFLKLRASYGQNGNFDIGNYESKALLSKDNYVFGSGDGTIVNGLRPGNLPNDKLTWEKTSSWNAGLDISFFQNKLELGIDVYERISKDFLFRVPLPYFTGFSSILENRGKIRNAGIEISTTYNQKLGDFELTANVNFSKNKNTVLELGPKGAPIIRQGGASGANYITKIGEPIGSYFLYVADGVFANQAEIDAVPHYPDARPGDIRYVDVDGDGDIDTDDRKIVGSYNPDYTLGGRLNLKYKWFDLGVAVTSVQGTEILNLHRRYSSNVTGNFNQFGSAINRWRSEDNPGDGQTIRAKSSTGKNSRISTRHVEDGSYVKIQNISFGINLPTEITKKYSISRARLSVGVQNPFIWTKYTGYNPEVNARPNSATSAGEDYGSYPLTKTFTMSLSLTF